MAKYIPADKLNKSVNRYRDNAKAAFNPIEDDADYYKGKIDACEDIQDVITSLQQEQPKFNVGDLVVSKKNPHLTYRILATSIPNELGKTDYKVEIFTDGKPGLLGEPHNIHLISSDKIEDWGELVQQEQPEVDLEKELIQWHKKHFKRSGTFEEYSGFYLENSSQLSIARHFYELGLNARKEENK